ncbi:MAG: hypothetical protein WCT12_11775, partial [Verrucomicrobiota bacterium]
GGAGFLRGKSDLAGSRVGGVLAAVALATGGIGSGPSPAGRGTREREWLARAGGARVTETQPTSGDGSLPVHIHAVDQGSGGAGFLRGKSDLAGSRVGEVLAAGVAGSGRKRFVAVASGAMGWGLDTRNLENIMRAVYRLAPDGITKTNAHQVWKTVAAENGLSYIVT